MSELQTWSAGEEEQASAICAYICVSKIGVYVDAGKGTALPALVCVRGNVSIKCVCVCILLLARPADGKNGSCIHRARVGETSWVWEYTGFSSVGWRRRDAPGPEAHLIQPLLSSHEV